MFPSPATSTVSFLNRTGINSKEIKKELLQWGENLELTARDTRVTAWRWDFRTSKLQYSPHFREVFGFAAAEPVTYDTWTTHLHPRFREDALRSFAEFIEGSSRIYHDEQPYITAGGETRWVETRSLMERTPHGKPVRVTSLSVDITQAKKIKQQLEDSREFLLLAQSAAEIGSWEWDLATGRHEWSPENYRLFGVPEDQGAPNWDAWLNLVHPDDRARVMELWRRVEHNEQNTIEIEFRTLPRSSGTRCIRLKGRVHRNKAGAAIRLVGANSDVTARRQAEEELRRVEKLAVAERMASSMAHEINNPLEALSNLLYIINNSSSLEDAHKYSFMAEKELQRVTQLTNQALRFHRQNARPVPVRVSDVVRSVMLLHEHLSERTNVQLTLDFKDTQLLTAHEDELRQLFSNLIRNALEAIPAGGRILLRVFEGTNHRTQEAGIRALIADTGPGMTAEVKKGLFDPFFTTKSGTAIGLGLWVSLEIAKKHGGSIRIRSSQAKQNHGTVVSVFLPFRNSESFLRAAASDAPHLQTTAPVSLLA